MVKIVVNRCYGGFGLSPLAQKRYLEIIGKECYFYKQTKFAHENDGIAVFERISLQNAHNAFMAHTSTLDLGDIIHEFPSGGYWYDHNLERDDPVLIRVVEELGQLANEKYSNLEIVEIPDDIEWQIEEYDGYEHVAEKHRTW